MINYQIDKNTHKELLLLYKELLVNTSEFLKEDLELNTISKICASYTYMYENGYLSFNHNFVFSDYYAKMLGYNNFDIFGLIIITGTGICRNITPFLTDLLNTMNYSCYNMSLDNVGRFLNKEKTLLIYTKLFPKLLGTHVINYIKNGNEHIVFDIEPHGRCEHAGDLYGLGEGVHAPRTLLLCREAERAADGKADGGDGIGRGEDTRSEDAEHPKDQRGGKGNRNIVVGGAVLPGD